MTHYGHRTSIYLQKHIEEIVDKVVDNDKELWKSRSQFVNSAVYKMLRDLGEVPPIQEEKL